MMKKIFICYSHNDIEAKTDLEKFLRQYSMNNLLDFWSDEDLKVGDEWKEKIIQSINNSCAAILLVSVDFLISKFITEEEIPRIFKKKNDKEMDVFPLVVGHCDLESNENISKLQVRPLGATPLPLSGSKRKAILKDFAKEIKDLVNSNGVSDTREEIDIINEKDDSTPIENEINLPIIVQIHQYLTQEYKELSFVPIHLLTNKYPFKKEDSFYPYYGSFSVSSDNEQLTDFFKSLTIKEDTITFNNKELIKGVKQVESKTKYVLNKLTNNLLFNIEDENHVRINIRYESAKVCNCIRCRLLRFEYSEVFKQLKSKPINLEDIMKLAYVNYQIGNFIESTKLFKKALEIAENEDKKVTQFIIKFNLSKLLLFVRTWYWENTKLIKELKEINLTESFCTLKTDDNEAILSWIYKSDFYSNSREKIEDLTRKIIESYHLQLKGGYSSDGYLSGLVNEYAKADLFIQDNFIIYDKFSEYKKLNDVVFEGLFASHAISEEDGGKRLQYFDDWMLRGLINYLNPESTLKFIDKYDLKSIQYQPTGKEGYTFFDVTSRILKSHKKDKDAFNKYCNKKNTNFWSSYDRLINNIFILYGVVEINDKKANLLAQEILFFIEESSLPKHIKYVKSFIKYKGKQLNKTVLKQFLKIGLKNHSFFDEYYIETICSIINNQHSLISISKTDLDKFIKMSTQDCTTCVGKHSAIVLVHLYRVLDSPEQNQRIKETIEILLKSKFDAYLYFMACIYDVIEVKLKDENFKKYVDLILPKKQVNDKILKPVNNLFGGRKDRNSKLDMLLNICFKYNLDLKKEPFIQFKGINNYYDWLLDIKDFDYEMFDPSWIKEYPTIYYLEEFSKHTIIKEKLEAYLRVNEDIELQKIYISLNTN